MTISKTRIFNMALNELGVSAPIQNADAQDDNRAIILRNFYEIARDEVLKAFDWNFAERYRVLTPTQDECLDPNFKFVYDYPNDCLCARDLYQKVDENSEYKNRAADEGLTYKFRLSANDDGQKVLLADISPAVLRYTRKVEKEIFFDPEYAIALSLYLAGLTGKAITGSEDKANAALKKYDYKMKSGMIANASEGQEVDEDNSTYLNVR